MDGDDKEKSDLFWSIDPTILLSMNRLTEFWPRPDFTLAEKLNCVSRLGIYIGIVVCLYHRDWKYLYITLMFLVLTQFLYSHGIDENKEEFQGNEKNGIKETKPTLNNPFMNPSIVDIADNPKKPPAQFFSDNTEKSVAVRKDIEDKFSYNLYKDVSEVFGSNNSARQFYTASSTSIPNDRESFQNWLYGSAPSCKDNNMNCIQNEDIRYKRPQFFDTDPVK